MTLEILVFLFVIVPVVTFADALRDRWRASYERAAIAPRLVWKYSHKLVGILPSRFVQWLGYLFSRPRTWWRWHLAKWIQFYTPFAFIAYLLWPNLKWYELTLAALAMFFAWRRAYYYKGN